ncbi:hypothetical protein ACIHFE_17980 [Streptomyces sp. NPDC052396]|uniref:hypothetical protein n=1 Tax=Streptomyces sp. NPDC052396 TaxID=3365689 RepID=UPI0037D87448
MPTWTPRLTNVKGADGTAGSGAFSKSGDVVTFTADIVAKRETVSADTGGFGLTLPVPAKPGARYVFALSLDGRDADHGVWAGQAQIYAGSDGAQIDRLRVVGIENGSALRNVTAFYGGDGATKGEILTVTGSYVAA